MTSEGTLFDAHPAAFGRFRVLHQLGAGSLGPVFLAEDPERSLSVVVKVVAELTPGRARAVAKALEGLLTHDLDSVAVAAPIAVGLQGREPYVVTPLAPGQALDVALREYGPAAIADALPRLAALAAGLDRAAEQGVWHGGLHPQDIVVSADETTLTGIGIAQTLESARVPLPARRPYTSPEQLNGGLSSPGGDQFALAAIAYEWLFGRAIAGAVTATMEVPALPGVAAERLALAFATALSANPRERFASCRAFVDALADAVVDPEVAPVTGRGGSRGAAGQLLPLELATEADTPAGDLYATDDTGLHGIEPIADIQPPASLDELRLNEGPELEESAPRLGPTDWQPEPELEPELAVVPVPAPVRYEPEAPPAFAASTADTRRFGGGTILFALLIGLALGAVAVYVVLNRTGADTGTTQAPAPASAGEEPGAATEEDLGREEGPGDARSPADVPPPADAPRTTGTPTRVPPVPSIVTPEAEPEPAPVPASRAGRLLVRSTPAGASVTIDGQPVGVTPLALRDLPLGARNVRVALAGFAPIEQRIALTRDRPSRSLEVRLTLGAPGATPAQTAAPAPAPPAAPPPARTATGALRIESRPAGATVSINGRPAGQTPVTVDALAPGIYTVRLEREGYRVWTTTATVQAGEQVRVAASLVGGQEEE